MFKPSVEIKYVYANPAAANQAYNLGLMIYTYSEEILLIQPCLFPAPCLNKMTLTGIYSAQ